jgi:hypothetical protein
LLAGKKLVSGAKVRQASRYRSDTVVSTGSPTADREFEGWRQSLSHAFQLAEFIKDDEIAHRYLLHYGPTGASGRHIAQKAPTTATIGQTMKLSDHAGNLCSRVAPSGYH